MATAILDSIKIDVERDNKKALSGKERVTFFKVKYLGKRGRSKTREVHLSSLPNGVRGNAESMMHALIGARKMSALIPEGEIVQFNIKALEDAACALFLEGEKASEALDHIPQADRSDILNKFTARFEEITRASQDYCEYVARMRVDSITLESEVVSELGSHISQSLSAYKQLEAAKTEA